MFVGGVWKAAAQQPEAENARKAEKPLNAYRLDFSVNEMEDGKKINTRQYSMNLNSDNSNELKIGTRVPGRIETGRVPVHYVGQAFGAELRSAAEPSICRCAPRSAIRESEQTPGHDMLPLLRQLKISAGPSPCWASRCWSAVLNDPNSKRQFQLEVTVTKLK